MEILSNDLSKKFELLTTTEVTSFEKWFLLENRVSNQHQTSTNGVQYLTLLNDGLQQSVTCVALLNHNFPLTSTMTLQMSDDDFSTFDTEVFDTQVTPLKRHDGISVVSYDRYDSFVVKNLTYQSYRVKLDSTSVPTFFSGRLLLTSTFTDIHNPKYTYTGGISAINSVLQSRVSDSKENQGQKFSLSFNFPALNAVDRSAIDIASISNEVLIKFLGVYRFGFIESTLPTGVTSKKMSRNITFVEYR